MSSKVLRYLKVGKFVMQ